MGRSRLANGKAQNLAALGSWGILAGLKKLREALKSPRTWAVLCGLLLTAAYPKVGLAGAAWVAPGLILLAGRPSPFRLGCLAGFAHFTTALYWLLLIPFPAGAVLGWFLLSSYLAAFMGSWVWFCWRIAPVPARTMGKWWLDWSETSWPARMRWAVSCALAWVAMEVIIGRFLSGFPWLLLGMSQYRLLPLIQVASFTGVYGVSFLAVWFSISLSSAGIQLLQSASRPRALAGEVFLPLLASAGVTAWGYGQCLIPRSPGPILRLALIQPSIRQEMIFDPREDGARFTSLFELSRAALAEKPDLLVWPEASMPGFNPTNFAAMTNLVASAHAGWIFGADDAEPKPGKADEVDAFNAGFFFDAAGQYAGSYRKRRLVLFGEYIPDWLPFLKRMIPIGSFKPGDRFIPFRGTDPKFNASILICYEDVFPHWTREYVGSDTDFLLNLTNDGWFGRSAAQWQQACDAIFRAVENRIPLVRCTNNGLTCWVDESGRLRRIFRDQNGSVYGPGFLVVEIPLLRPGEKRAATFYNQHGDWFGWACVTLTAVFGIAARRRPALDR